MSMSRVIARWADDTLESPLAVDVAIEDRRIVGPSLAFGCIDYDGARRPFTLDEAGVIAFGPGAEVWRTELRDTDIRVGVTFRIFWGQGDEGVYKIVKIATPGSKG
jgi:hypothetical protein